MITISQINDKDLSLVDGVVECEDIYEVAATIMEFNWSPATYIGRKRNLKSFAKTDLIVLDVDEGCTLDEAKGIFKEYQHIIGTTKSHQKEKNGQVCDRFRVVLFCEDLIDNAEDYKRTYKRLLEQYPFIDKATSDASRFFYPSNDITSINKGKRIKTERYVKPEPVKAEVSREGKGDLWKSTYQFIAEGAPDGMWHDALIKAAGDLCEQGYTIDEAKELLSRPTGHLDDHDLYQIEHMYSKEHKFEFRDRDEPEPLSNKASDLLESSFAYLEDKDAVKGDPTGIEGLDKLLGGGFREGEITVLMAQAKTGKNTLYHYMMHKMLTRGQSIGYASRELDPANEVMPNLFSLELKKNAWLEELNASDREILTKKVSAWKLYFAHGYGYFPLDLVEEWIKVSVTQGIKSFWMDHLHYMLAEEDHKEAAKFMRRLKTLTKQFPIHINLIVQPTKLAQDQRLGLNTVRGGSAVGQALDNLFILERVNDQNHKNIARLKLEVARHKLARPGSIYLQYNPVDTSFIEMEKEKVTPRQEQQVQSFRGQRTFNGPRIVE